MQKKIFFSSGIINSMRSTIFTKFCQMVHAATMTSSLLFSLFIILSYMNYVKFRKIGRNIKKKGMFYF